MSKYLNFSYDSNKTFANIFFMFFTSKIFFCCKSNKRKVRSKWELILRPLSLIVSNVTSYNFIPIISSCFLRQKFYLFTKKKEHDPNEKMVSSTWLTSNIYIFAYEIKENNFLIFFTSKILEKIYKMMHLKQLQMKLSKPAPFWILFPSFLVHNKKQKRKKI